MGVGINHIESAEDVVVTHMSQVAPRVHVTEKESTSSPLQLEIPDLEPVRIKTDFKKKRVRSTSIKRAATRTNSQVVVDLCQGQFLFFENESLLGGVA